MFTTGCIPVHNITQGCHTYVLNNIHATKMAPYRDIPVPNTQQTSGHTNDRPATTQEPSPQGA